MISVNYVYIEKSLWSCLPFKNLMWTITSLLVFVLRLEVILEKKKILIITFILVFLYKWLSR